MTRIDTWDEITIQVNNKLSEHTLTPSGMTDNFVLEHWFEGWFEGWE